MSIFANINGNIVSGSDEILNALRRIQTPRFHLDILGLELGYDTFEPSILNLHKKTCIECKRELFPAKVFFSEKEERCCVCIKAKRRKYCSVCKSVKPRAFFTKNQLKRGSFAVCLECNHDRRLKLAKRLCEGCGEEKNKTEFSMNQLKAEVPRMRRCKSCMQIKQTMKAQKTVFERVCKTCKKTVGRNCYSLNQWKKGFPESDCNNCVQEKVSAKKNRLCLGCKKLLPVAEFAFDELDKKASLEGEDGPMCLNCSGQAMMEFKRTCSVCKMEKLHTDFTRRQWRIATRDPDMKISCKNCSLGISDGLKLCHNCKIFFEKSHFGWEDWHKAKNDPATCKHCKTSQKFQEESQKNHNAIYGGSIDDLENLCHSRLEFIYEYSSE